VNHKRRLIEDSGRIAISKACICTFSPFALIATVYESKGILDVIGLIKVKTGWIAEVIEPKDGCQKDYAKWSPGLE
jgi:hypothetical protein